MWNHLVVCSCLGLEPCFQSGFARQPRVAFRVEGAKLPESTSPDMSYCQETTPSIQHASSLTRIPYQPYLMPLDEVLTLAHIA